MELLSALTPTAEPVELRFAFQIFTAEPDSLFMRKTHHCFVVSKRLHNCVNEQSWLVVKAII